MGRQWAFRNGFAVFARKPEPVFPHALQNTAARKSGERQGILSLLALRLRRTDRKETHGGYGG